MRLRSRGSIAGFACALVAALVHAAPARANGRFPAANAIVFDPSDDQRIYLRATFGLSVSSDGGKTWDWICERALGFSGPEDPTVGVFSDGSLSVSLFEGLSMSHDKGCGFAFVPAPLEKKVFVDIATRAPVHDAAFAISSGYANRSSDAGEPMFLSEVWRTDDRGQTWRPSGKALDPGLLLETIDWSKKDEKRVYVSAARGSGKNQKGVLLRSDDGGATFVERAIPFNAGERAPFIAAIDPNDANVVYVRIVGAVDAGSRLVVTRDGGLTYKTIFETKTLMRGFALSDDGKKIFAGSSKDGLWQGSSDVDGGAFVKRSSVDIECLAWKRDSLWACSSEASGFVAGVSSDDGATFASRYHLRDLRGPLDCPAGTRTHDLCRPDWPSLEATLGIEKKSDAGAVPAIASARPAASSNANASGGACGCNAIGSSRSPENSGRFAIALAFVIALAIRARNGSRGPSST